MLEYYSVKAADMAAHHNEHALVNGVPQANALARLVDLQNAYAAGVAFENRRRVIIRDAQRCKVRVCSSPRSSSSQIGFETVTG